MYGLNYFIYLETSDFLLYSGPLFELSFLMLNLGQDTRSGTPGNFWKQYGTILDPFALAAQNTFKHS